MDWREVTIYTTTEGIGPVEAVLEDNGIEGYVLEDAADFEEFLKDTEIYWDYVDEELVREKRAQETCLKIYLSDDEAGAKQYAALRTSLENLKVRDEEHAWGRLVTETALTRQEDWEWGWKQYFKPFPVGHSFMIKPSWETVDDAQGRRILEIDEKNHVSIGRGLCGDALRDEKLAADIGSGYSVIVANIVADVIIGMAPMFFAKTAEGGTLICSGILNERADEVRAALEKAGFEVVNHAKSDDWSAFTAKK